MTTPDETELLDLIPPEAEIVRRIVDEVRRYPRIRRPLLRFLAADDFDALMAAVEENSENIKLVLERMGGMENRMGGMENRMGGMENRMGGMENRMGGMENRMGGMEERLTSVEESVARIPVIEERLTSVEESVARIPAIEERLTSVEGAVERIDRNVRSLQGSVGQLRGDSYENKCSAEIEGILDGYLKNAVLADRNRITAAFRNARDNGLITREEFLDHYRPDIIARTAHDDREAEGLAVVEVSVTFNREDLETSGRRAQLIGRVTGVPTSAYLVTHHEWPADMATLAQTLGVTIIRHAIPEYATSE